MQKGKEAIEQQYYHLTTWKKAERKVVDDAIEDILFVAKMEIDKPLREIEVLDVGCGAGSYSFGVEKHVKKVVGVEPFGLAYKQALINKEREESKIVFVNTPVEEYTTKERFDLVLSLTTIEHMQNAEASFNTIFALLRSGGVIYLTAPNK